MSANGWAETVQVRLQQAGIEADLIEQARVSQDFGDTSAIFRAGSLLLRVLRDRGCEYALLASARWPTEFYSVVDVEVALGWAKPIPPWETESGYDAPSLNEDLHRLGTRLGQLDEAWNGADAEVIRERIQQATTRREEAWTRYLRGDLKRPDGSTPGSGS